MNNNYRIVWSDARQAFVVTHEAAGSHGKPSSTQINIAQAVASLVMALGAGHALGACPAAVSGTITVSASSSFCSLNTGESLVVTSSGSITGSTAVSVNGTTAQTIQNAGYLDGTADTSIHILNSGILASLTNTGTIHGLSYGVYVDNGTITAALINNGLIDPGQTGMRLNTAVIGSITNTGTISVSAMGMSISSSTVSGGVLNSGVINTGEYGISVNNSTVSGGINNSGHINSTGSSGIRIRSNSVISGGITNSGTIDVQAPSYDDSDIYILSSTVTGDIVNSGLMQIVSGSEYGYGLRLDSSTLNGSISNSGTIHATTPGSSSAYGVRLDSTTITGGIANSGLIQGGIGGTEVGYGVYVNGTSVAGAITNSGTISGQGSSDGFGIYVSGSTLVGGITNSGSITGSSQGIGIQSSTVSGNIVNQAGGTISGGQEGIDVDSNSVLSGISNAGLITGAAHALNLNNSTDAFTVANSGTLQGDVNLGINSLDLNGASSRVTGATTGTGIVNVNGTFTNESTFDVGTFNVASGGLFNIVNGVTVGGGGFHNAGILNVGSASPTITGDYTQAASGVYRFSLIDATSNYGKLHVTGNATLANGSTVNVNVVGSPPITNGATVAGVIVATGALSATADNITVTDNSALYNFTAATVSSPGHALDLVVTADSNGLPSAVVNTNNPAALGAATVLQQLRNTAIPEAMQPVFDRLNQMTEQEASNALSQALPALLGAGSQAGINALHSMNKVIQSRVESSHGLSSGDEVKDRYMWVRGFGNWARQNDRNGVSGFDSNTSGLVIGGDAPVSPRVRAGGAFTYAKSSIESKSSVAPSTVDVDTYELVGYASYNIDPQTDINYQIDIGQNRASSRRDIGFMGTQATADFTSTAVHGSVGLGRVMPLSAQTNATPSVRLDYTHMRTDGYTEDGGGPLNLSVDAQTYREFLLTTDLKVAHQFDQGIKLVANGSVGYDFINKQAKTTAIFTGGGSAFVTEGLAVSPWFYRVGLGLIKEDGKGMEYSLRYDMEGRTSGYLNQTVSAKVRWAF